MMELINHCVIISLLCIGLYLSLYICNFLSFTSLATPFLASVIFSWFVSLSPGFVEAFAFILISSTVVGFISSISLYCLNTKASVDRLTSSLILFLVIRAVAVYLSNSGYIDLGVRSSNTLTPLLINISISIFFLFLVLIFLRSIVGLGTKAFSRNLEECGRFWLLKRSVLFPGLLIVETIIATSGPLWVYTFRSIDQTWAFEPVLIGLASASMVHKSVARLPNFWKFILVIVPVVVWRLGFRVGRDIVNTTYASSELQSLFSAIFVAVFCVIIFCVGRYFKLGDVEG